MTSLRKAQKMRSMLASSVPMEKDWNTLQSVFDFWHTAGRLDSIYWVMD